MSEKKLYRVIDDSAVRGFGPEIGDIVAHDSSDSTYITCRPYMPADRGWRLLCFYRNQLEPYTEPQAELQQIEKESKMTELKDILNQRKNTHGNFDQVAEIAQGLKDTLRDGPNWARDEEMDNAQYEALEMIASKLARIVCGNSREPDHWRDIAGYATLVANLLEAK